MASGTCPKPLNNVKYTLETTKWPFGRATFDLRNTKLSLSSCDIRLSEEVPLFLHISGLQKAQRIGYSLSKCLSSWILRSKILDFWKLLHRTSVYKGTKASLDLIGLVWRLYENYWVTPDYRSTLNFHVLHFLFSWPEYFAQHNSVRQLNMSTLSWTRNCSYNIHNVTHILTSLLM